MKIFHYNMDDAEFVDRSGEKLSRFVPELFYQERAEWRIFLRDGENAAVDISDIVAWGAAVDRDYRGETAPMCRTLSGDIAADAEAGSVTVKLDAATAEFLAAVDGMRKRKAFFALYGLDRDGERRLQLEFEISARMIIDPDPVAPLQAPDTLATRAYVSARIGSAADLAYAAACEGMSGAMASGGYVTSSGARVVAADVAASATSGAVFSDAEFDTVVGDNRLTFTSGGGFTVSGGGVSLHVSGGAVDITSGNLAVRGADVLADNLSAGNTLTATIAQIDILNAGNMTVNARAVLTELVSERMNVDDPDSPTVSMSVVSGGTRYVCDTPLALLSVASVASSEQETWLEFTVASGGSVSINDSGYKYLGGRPSAFEGGSSYAVGFRWGRQAVCTPLEG